MRQLVKSVTVMHRPIVWVVQAAIFALSAILAFLLRFDFRLPHEYAHDFAYALPIWVLVKISVFRVANLHRGWWRYVSVADLVRIGVGNFAGSVIGGFVIFLIASGGFPRSIYLLDLMVCFLGTAGVRVLVRLMAEAASHSRNGVPEKNALIYGAGDAGVTLLREIQNNRRLAYRVQYQIRNTLKGKVVLVTGAAGSIGSELSRQIARFHPKAIVGFDIAESPLFEIDREMRVTLRAVPFHPEIGSHRIRPFALPTYGRH